MDKLELSFSQVASGLKLETSLRSDFCLILHKNKHHFAFFTPTNTALVKCYYLNHQHFVNPTDIIAIVSNCIVPENFLLESSLPPLAEFLPFKRTITEDKLYRFFLGLLPLEETEVEESIFRCFSNEIFENVYANSNRKELSVILKSTRNDLLDIIDFNEKNFIQRFSFDFHFWTSQYYSNMNHAVITTNPANLTNFFSERDNIPFDFFSIVINQSVNPIIANDIYSILAEKNFSKSFFLYRLTFDEVLSLAQYSAYIYNISSFTNLEISLTKNFLYITFTVKPKDDITDLFQFDSDLNAYLRSFTNTESPLSPETNDSICFTSHKTETKFVKQLHIVAPLKMEVLLSFAFAIIKFGKLKIEPVKIHTNEEHK